MQRYKALVGKHVVLPLVGREIPIVADDYADPEKGSGAVKITPAHDFNDAEVGKRHKLEVINIFTEHAKLNDDVPAAYRGMDRVDARKKVVADLHALGLVAKIELDDARRAALAARRRHHRAVSDRPVVRRRGDAGQAGARSRAHGQDALRAGALCGRLFPLAREYPAVVHLAPAVVGAPDPGVVRAGQAHLRRHGRRRRQGAGAEALRQGARRSRATPTCSTPGSPRACGRSRRSAGRSRRRN